MTRNGLEKMLLTDLPRCILLYGENEFLINYYSKMIQNKLEGNISTFYFGDYHHEQVLGFLGTNNLFGEKSSLVIKHYNVFNKKQLQEIFSTLTHNPNSFLIVELHKSPNISDTEYAKRFKAMSALFKPTNKFKEVFEVRLYNPSLSEMLQILSKRAKELQLPINSNLLEYLLTIQYYDLSIAYSELEKFIYYSSIDKQLIDELSYSLGNVNIDFLLNALFDKRNNLAKILHTLHDEGVDNTELLRELHRYFYILFKLYGHSRQYGSMDCKQALGYQPPAHILEIWSKRSLKLTTQKYLMLFDLLNAWRNAQFHGKDVSMQYLVAIQEIL
ncbi:DNA polymerase III subunit delta [Helicobacter sp. MIT 14-3879]|uniref:DNA polymerase III subunit delta n=1 Tax=Helicobacter sp. MIT 14-3879 TaxID=2040649 RepID=UPI000E1E3DEA|nr:DNA polymerase III subunit delta [Helicobacter sp. MIT 14-3879]RDU61406.1 DNA polymerase III subunit delta [Helicobacter sp. MIT 14-3879]